MAEARKLKQRILRRLAEPDWEALLPELAGLGQQAVSPLFSALCNASATVRWRAVTAFGEVVAQMAGDTPEKARVVMRRFIWSLNDESGGIGWGAPEAMAEIMAASPRMAAEYHNHLLAYIHDADHRPDCYLEHAPLRRGAVWGVGRLAQARPELARPAEADLIHALDDCDRIIRGLAAWACGLLKLQAALPQLRLFHADHSPLEIYLDRKLEIRTPAMLAAEAVSRITGAASEKI